MNVYIKPSSLKNNKTVHIHGHKHSFVQIVSAALIMNQECMITNVPSVDDVHIFQQIITEIGGIAKYKNHTFYFNPHGIKNRDLDSELCHKIHGSFYLIFAMAVRFGTLQPCDTGGCQIGSVGNYGARPDKHLTEILNNTKNVIDVMKFSDNTKKLSGELVSSATKLSILKALDDSGKTIILNPYFRTDVYDLLEFLKVCGYKATRTSKQITIEKTRQSPELVEYQLSDCQSEVFTYITLAIIHKVQITLVVKNSDFVRKILKFELIKLRDMGADIVFYDDKIIVYKQTKPLIAQNIIIDQKTIQSDHHPFFTLLLLHSCGKAHLTENVWKNRFGYAEELNKIEANIIRKDNKIYINPLVRLVCLKDVSFDGRDTRTCAVLLIMALKLKSDVRIINIQHLTRGYDEFIETLIEIGAKISK